MKQVKYYLYLSPAENRLLFRALLSFRNKLIAEGRYADAVDDVLFKLSKAR